MMEDNKSSALFGILISNPCLAFNQLFTFLFKKSAHIGRLNCFLQINVVNPEHPTILSKYFGVLEFPRFLKRNSIMYCSLHTYCLSLIIVHQSLLNSHQAFSSVYITSSAIALSINHTLTHTHTLTHIRIHTCVRTHAYSVLTSYSIPCLMGSVTCHSLPQ